MYLSSDCAIFRYVINVRKHLVSSWEVFRTKNFEKVSVLHLREVSALERAQVQRDKWNSAGTQIYCPLQSVRLERVDCIEKQGFWPPTGRYDRIAVVWQLPEACFLIGSLCSSSFVFSEGVIVLFVLPIVLLTNPTSCYMTVMTTCGWQVVRWRLMHNGLFHCSFQTSTSWLEFDSMSYRLGTIFMTIWQTGLHRLHRVRSPYPA